MMKTTSILMAALGDSITFSIHEVEQKIFGFLLRKTMSFYTEQEFLEQP